MRGFASEIIQARGKNQAEAGGTWERTSGQKTNSKVVEHVKGLVTPGRNSKTQPMDREWGETGGQKKKTGDINSGFERAGKL